MHRTKVVAVVIGAALAGAAASVAVAWGASLAGNTPPPPAGPQAYLAPIQGTDTWSWFVNEHRGPAHAAYIFRKANMRPPFPASRAIPSRDPATLPRWAPVPASGMKVEVHGFGWPWPCLWGSRSDPTGESTFLRVRTRAIGRRELRVPVEPIAIGLVVDSVVWGGMFAAAGFGAGALRARRRCARGRCPGCNYDLTGAPHAACPECGGPAVDRQADVANNNDWAQSIWRASAVASPSHLRVCSRDAVVDHN